MSQACRTYIRANLDMNLFSLIYNYKSNLSYAPMLSGRKGSEKGGHDGGQYLILQGNTATGYSAYPRTEILQLLYGLCEDRLPEISGISLCKTLFGRTCFLPGVLPVI